MVNSMPDFEEQPKVINGASDLLLEVFGAKGKHARSAVGMAQLPFSSSLEIEGIFEVRSCSSLKNPGLYNKYRLSRN
jgi:enamine deaminase RidA (YjgF/YER057c/UK114 family)